MQANDTAQQLYDIYPLWHVPFWQTTFFYGLVIFFIAAAIVSVVYYFWKKHRSKIRPMRPAWERALGELRALEQKKIITKEDGKEFYFALTNIIKRYMHERYHMPVVGKTDDEFIAYLKESNQLPEFIEILHDIAQGCLYIKFANEQAMQDQIARHVAASILIITKTIPTEIKK